jgi:glycerol uptake facilitator-like aquaporin
MSLKAAVTMEFIGSLTISVATGFFYSGDNLLRQDPFANMYPSEASILAGGLIGVLTMISFGYSGAHFNWVLTIPQMICRKITIKAGACYLIAQLVGYALGGAIIYGLIPNVYYNAEMTYRESTDVILRNPPFEIVKATIYLDNQGGRNTSQVLSEVVCTFMLVFGYFLATSMKSLNSAGVGLVMGLTYFSIVTHSVYGSTGVVNPIKLLGYLYIREDAGRWINSDRSDMWTLLATPIPIAILFSLVLPIIFIGKSPFYRSRRAESMIASQLIDVEPTVDKKSLEEPLVTNRGASNTDLN